MGLEGGMEAGHGKITSHHRPDTCTYSAYEYRIHRNGISILNAILGLFFCGLLCLDLFGNIHRIEEGANPASFRLFCLCEICLCTYMRVQNNRGNATQVNYISDMRGLVVPVTFVQHSATTSTVLQHLHVVP